ncbi:hypothetical protein ACQKMI_08865 [Lysinibacillus sp. NPDC097214]|uniref:hypothetical protein n=1 Tax=Lysinibacillus sp. NPDC097214 TaxID=3390584 RepID=UPI003D0931BF
MGILDLFLTFMQDETHSILFSSHITSDLEKTADYLTFILEKFYLVKRWMYWSKYSILKGNNEEVSEIPEDKNSVMNQK